MNNLHIIPFRELLCLNCVVNDSEMKELAQRLPNQKLTYIDSKQAQNGIAANSAQAVSDWTGGDASANRLAAVKAAASAASFTATTDPDDSHLAVSPTAHCFPGTRPWRRSGVGSEA